MTQDLPAPVGQVHYHGPEQPGADSPSPTEEEPISPDRGWRLAVRGTILASGIVLTGGLATENFADASGQRVSAAVAEVRGLPETAALHHRAARQQNAQGWTMTVISGSLLVGAGAYAGRQYRPPTEALPASDSAGTPPDPDPATK